MLVDSEQHHRLRTGSRAFLEDHRPLTRIPELFDHPLGFDRQLWKQASFLGWYGMLVPERYGGFSLTAHPLLDLIVVVEEHGRLVQPAPLVPTNVVAYAIGQFGTEQQKKQHLLAIASGETIAAWCMAEDPRLWRVTDLAVTAEATDSGFVLNGSKVCVQDAEAADLLLVTARTGAGLVQLLIPARPRGVTLWPRKGVDPTRRLYDVRFDGVVLPASAALGVGGQTEKQVEQQLRIAKVLQCAESAAGAARLVELCLQGEGSPQCPLDPGQEAQRRIADLCVAAETAAVATRSAALAVAERRADAAVAVDVAEIAVNDAYAFVADQAIRVCGGPELADGGDLQLYLYRAKGNQLLLGDAGVHREHLLRVVADHVRHSPVCK